MIGNLLVLLYSCARHSDGLRAQELIVDVPEDQEVNARSVENQGFLELAVLAHKGAYTTVMKRTMLPVVAPMYSLSSASWHLTWLQAREALGLDKSASSRTHCFADLNRMVNLQCRLQHHQR